MNKCSHIMIGERIFELLKENYGIYLEKESFIKGNVIPDFSYYAIAHPHFMNLSLGFVQSKIKSLTHTYLKSAFIGRDYSYRLGIICHYYADFFCYAHSSGYKQAVINHLKYEHLLNLYFQENISLYTNAEIEISGEVCDSSDGIIKKMHKLHEQYSCSENSYYNDLFYALKACAETALSVVYCSQTRTASVPMELTNYRTVSNAIMTARCQ